MALKIGSTNSPLVGIAAEPGWNVSEQITPNAIGDSTAETGGVSFTVPKVDGSEQIINKNVSVFYNSETTNTNSGNISGYFDSADVSGAGVQLTSTNVLNKTVPTFTASPTVTGSIQPFIPPYSLTQRPFSVFFQSTLKQFYVAYSAPNQNQAISIYSQTGKLINQFGAYSGTPSGGQVDAGGYLGGVVADYLGNVYAYDAVNYRVNKFDPNGNFLTSFGSNGSGNGQLGANYMFPSIGIDANRLVYVSDVQANGRVAVFDNTGAWQRNITGAGIVAGSPGKLIGNPYGDGFYYSWSGYAEQFSSTAFVTRYAPGGSSFSGFNIGSDTIAVAGNGDVYWTSQGTNGTWRLFVAGVVSTQSNVAEVDVSFLNPSDRTPVSMTFSGGRLFVATTTGASGQIYQSFSQTVTASDLFINYLSLALGNNFNYSFTGNNLPIVAGPWTDSVWTKLNELCAATNNEIVLQNDTVVVRAVGSVAMNVTLKTPPSTSLASNDSVTQQLAIQQYNSVSNLYIQQAAGIATIPNTPFYNAALTNDTYSTDVGQVDETTISTTFYGTYLNPPLLSTTTSYTSPIASLGMYSVYDNTGTQLTTNQITTYGIALSVRFGTNPGDIIIRIVGPKATIPGLVGPFTIGYAYPLVDPSGNKTSYSVPFLQLFGTGVITNPQTVTVWTGANSNQISNAEPDGIDNIFINTAQNVYSRGLVAACDASGPTQTISFTVPMEQIGGFGIAPGSLFTHGNCQYRVISATVGNIGVDVTAARYTTVGQHDALWSGQTVGTHDAAYAVNARRLSDIIVKPLAIS